MNSLTQRQRFVLLLLAVLDVLVIGGLILIVVTSTGRPARTAPEPPTATATSQAAVPTWTPTVTITPRPTLPARATNTPTPTSTPMSTATPTLTPTRAAMTPIPVTLVGADFDHILPNRIHGWEWDAYVNYRPGDTLDPETSYAEPLLSAADDAARQIDGSTLKVETMRWLKFRAWVYQTVTVTADSLVTFQIQAGAYSSLDRLIVKAGIDPTGANNCYGARWGQEQQINQESGVITLRSPTLRIPAIEPPDQGMAPEEDVTQAQVGRVTLCFFAEPTYAHVNNAAFFDRARISVQPPR